MMFSAWCKRNIVRLRNPRILPLWLEKEFKIEYFSPRHSNINTCFQEEWWEIRKYCTEQGFEFLLVGDEVRVISRYDCWRIIIEEGILTLYHKNTRKMKSPFRSSIKGFHPQACFSRTILGYLEKIAEHDNFKRKCRPKVEVEIKMHRTPEWLLEKYGGEIPQQDTKKICIKGTKKYKKEQKKFDKRKKKACVARVLSLIEEISA